jgi:hypothetical protein
MGAGLADPILLSEARDLVAFTVIVRGARRFAVLVAICCPPWMGVVPAVDLSWVLSRRATVMLS